MPGTLKYGCVLIPLGSPLRVQKRSYVHVPVVPWLVRGGGAGHERGTGWVRAGWVYRVGNTQAHPPSTQPAAARSTPEAPSVAGPGSPAGAGVGGVRGAGITGCSAAGSGSCTTLRARSGPLAPPCTGPLGMPPLANKGEI